MKRTRSERREVTEELSLSDIELTRAHDTERDEASLSSLVFTRVPPDDLPPRP